jgi:hypothetical protein
VKCSSVNTAASGTAKSSAGEKCHWKLVIRFVLSIDV